MTPILEPDSTDHADEQPAGGFEVRTVGSDASRARIEVGGDLDAGAAALLAEVLDGHARAGRRYLRLDLAGLRSISAAAVAVIAGVHERLLGAGGTMILTGVGTATDAALRAATPTSPLFLLPAGAAETIAAPEAGG